MKMPHEPFWYVAGGCATALTIVVVVLFFLPGAAPPPQVTIEAIHWQIEQSPPVNGSTEFSEQWINQSGAIWGFPFDLRPGGTFNDSLVLVNDEAYNVYICGASVTPPLYIVATNPGFPMVAIHQEDNLLILTLSVDAGAGAVLNASGVINALGCGSP